MNDFFGVVGTATSLEPLEQLVLRHPELQHRVDVGAAALEHLVQRLGLLDRAWIPVQDETVGRVIMVQSLVDQLIGQLGRYQITGIQIAFGLQAEFRAVADVSPEQLSRGDLRDPKLLGKLLGLRPLARPGRSKQNIFTEESFCHLRNPS